ncbi:hypothetical protein D9615_008740 [Tricholomella constricta]|uniref:GH16 domain-containing protein n=1 Tax=Tricholomella constricta TaxID=117010 RepID=A0A8H5M2H4_9AGAR|nr:hypothetical protein D9615_008740 [Tricholomella constricta]
MSSDAKSPASEPTQDPFASPASSRPSSIRPRTASSRGPSEAPSSPIPRSILILPSPTHAPRFSSTTSIPLRLPPKKLLPRMRSHMLTDDHPVVKPWNDHPPARAVFSYYLTYAVIFIGAVLGAVQTYFSYKGVVLDRKPLCLVFEENFENPERVFGENGTFFREVNMDGFGNGEFSMSTASTNNSFILDNKLHIVPTLTSDALGQAAIFDGTVYNITGCTFNITRPDNGHVVRDGQRVFDGDAYRRSCSMVSNATAGTVINPVQSARLTTRYSASIRYGRVERLGEIDIVESRGNGIRYTAHGSNYVQGSLNWGPAPNLNGVSKTYSWWTDKRKKFSDDFHTYALEWTEDFLRIYVDTRLHTLLDMRFNKPFFQRGEFPQVVFNGSSLVALQNPWINGTNATPFDQEFYLVLNVAVGSTSGWFPEGEGDKPWLDRAQNPMLDFAKAQGKWYKTWPATAGGGGWSWIM